MTFDHPDSSHNPSWHAHNVVAWKREDNGYRAMRWVFETTCKKTGTSWAKCLYFRRKGTEDDQINGCGNDEVTKLTGHG